jgi:hypothetical protein
MRPVGGVDPAHRQRPNTHSVLLGQDLGHFVADRQGAPLGPGHSPGIHSGGVGGGHQALTSSMVTARRSAAREMAVVASGAGSAPSPRRVASRPL